MGLFDRFTKSPLEQWRAKLPEGKSEEEWFAEGEREVEDALKIARLSDSHFERGCLEIGSGLGKRVQTLTNRFHALTCFEKSTHDVRLLKARFKETQRLRFGTFSPQNSERFLQDVYSFVYSHSHFDEMRTPDEAKLLVSRIYLCLADDGVVVIRCKDRTRDSEARTGYGIAFDRDDIHRCDQVKLKRVDAVRGNGTELFLRIGR